MTNREKIEKALAENTEVARQQAPDKAARTPPPEQQRTTEREGRSEWSGRSAGGGTWGGRSI